MTGTALERAPSAGAPPALVDFDELFRRATVLAKATTVIPKAFHGNPEAIAFVGMRGAELGFSLGYSIENIDVIEGKAVPNAQARLTLLRTHGHEARFTESTPERATLRARRRENRDDPDAWVEFTYTIEMATGKRKKPYLADLWVERKYRKDGDRFDRTEKRKVGDILAGVDSDLIDAACREAEADAEARREAGNAEAKPLLWVKREVDAGRVYSKDNWENDPASMLRARCITNVCRMEFSDVMAGAGVDLDVVERFETDLDDEVSEAEVVDQATPAEAAYDPEYDDIVDGELVPDAEEAPPAEEEPPAAVPTKEQVPDPQGDTSPHDTKSSDDTEQSGDDGEPARSLPQQIAIQANKAGIVRGDVILAVTKGRTSSGRECTPEEGAAVLKAIASIVHGDVVVEEAEDGGRRLVSKSMAEARDKARPAPEPGEPAKAKPVAPPAPGPPPATKEPETPTVPDGEEDTWDGNDWRAFLTARDVKVRDLIRQAVKESKELGLPPPPNLEALKGQQSLCALLRGWVEELAESRSS